MEESKSEQYAELYKSMAAERLLKSEGTMMAYLREVKSCYNAWMPRIDEARTDIIKANMLYQMLGRLLETANSLEREIVRWHAFNACMEQMCSNIDEYDRCIKEAREQKESKR